MILEVKNLSYSYKNHKVLNNICFSLEEGDCLAILGANGVGKSTLLKCINGVLHPLSGSILIDGRERHLYQNIELAKTMSYISQSTLFSDMTVFDSVLLGRKPYMRFNHSRKDIQMASTMISTLQLDHLAHSFTSEISGGERQKVSIARALTQDTKLLLFDEPTSNLDPKNQMDILSVISTLRKNESKTCMITLHDLNQAMQVANKFLLLQEGSVLAFGGEEVLTQEMLVKLYGIEVSLIEQNQEKVFVTTIRKEGL